MKIAKVLALLTVVALAIFVVARIANTQTTLPFGDNPGEIRTGETARAPQVLGNDQVLLAGLNALEALVGTSDGTVSTPLDVSGSLPRDSQVAAVGSSYYEVTGLTPSTQYMVSTSAQSADLDLQVFQTSGFSTGLQCISSNAGLSREGCLAISDGSGQLYIEVLASGRKSTFTLEVPFTCCLDEGDGTINILTGPVLISPSPLDGQVGTGTSYYRYAITTQTYAVTLTKLTDDVNLSISLWDNVYGDYRINCGTVSFLPGTTSESASCSAFGTGPMRIEVQGGSTVAGAIFTITVTP